MSNANAAGIFGQIFLYHDKIFLYHDKYMRAYATGIPKDLYEQDNFQKFISEMNDVYKKAKGN